MNRNNSVKFPIRALLGFAVLLPHAYFGVQTNTYELR